MRNFPVRPRAGLGAQLTWLNRREMTKDGAPSRAIVRYMNGYQHAFPGYQDGYFTRDGLFYPGNVESNKVSLAAISLCAAYQAEFVFGSVTRRVIKTNR